MSDISKKCATCGANEFYDRRDSYAEGYDDGVQAERERTRLTVTDEMVDAAEAVVTAAYGQGHGPATEESKRLTRKMLEAALREASR